MFYFLNPQLLACCYFNPFEGWKSLPESLDPATIEEGKEQTEIYSTNHKQFSFYLQASVSSSALPILLSIILVVVFLEILPLVMLGRFLLQHKFKYSKWFTCGSGWSSRLWEIYSVIFVTWRNWKTTWQSLCTGVNNNKVYFINL